MPAMIAPAEAARPRLTAAESARLEGLYLRYAARVARVAQARTRDFHAAEDVASETWTRAAAWIPTLRADDDHAWAWLATITRRAAIDYYRPRRSTEKPTDWDTAADMLPTAPAAEDEALTRAAMRAALLRCLAAQAATTPAPRAA